MEQLFTLTLAGLTLPCSFRFPGTEEWLGALPVHGPDTPSCDAERPVHIPLDEWGDYRDMGMEEGPVMEANVLSGFFSDALLPFDRLLIHAVAVRRREEAYLICAPSGVGKSTQARFLQELRPGEFSVICGDRPILQFCHSERSAAESKNPSSSILVHPSPWNGKENWHGATAAPLAGLILLERGQENNLRRLSPKEAGIPVYLQMIHTNHGEASVKRIAELTTELLYTVPAWKLTSDQVPDSTRLLLDAVFSQDDPSERGSAQ